MIENLKVIRLFCTAYETRSFTRTADACHATQSGVSQHMRNIEQRLGVKLFQRHAGRITPLPPADALYQSCLKILEACKETSRVMRRFSASARAAAEVRSATGRAENRAILSRDPRPSQELHL